MKKAVVTGAFGFIGRHVARAAAQDGYFVTGIGHGNWGRDEWRKWGVQEWRTCSITAETMATYAGSPDVLIHCAGSGSVAFSFANPLQDFQRTVDTTVAVLEYLRINSSQTKIVLPSSAGVYGVANKIPIHINTPLNPKSPYGMHKKIAEELCQTYGNHFGINVALVRLFSVYGNGLRKQLLWDCCQKIADKNPIFFGTGAETRDWIHVEDAAALLLKATLHATPSCPIANGGTGVAIPIQDVVKKIVAYYGENIEPKFNGQERSGDPRHYQADINEALAWGWLPGHRFDDQLKNYIAWFKSEMA